MCKRFVPDAVMAMTMNPAGIETDDHAVAWPRGGVFTLGRRGTAG